MNLSRILIVEDQQAPREALEHAVDIVMPRYDTTYAPERRKTATCYSEASELLTQNQYDLILLDHRIPIQPTGNLENENFDLFSAQLANVGYGLVHLIQQRSSNSILIGTSSLSRHECCDFVSPSYAISKKQREAERDLDAVLGRVQGEGEHGR